MVTSTDEQIAVKLSMKITAVHILVKILYVHDLAACQNPIPHSEKCGQAKRWYGNKYSRQCSGCFNTSAHVTLPLTFSITPGRSSCTIQASADDGMVVDHLNDGKYPAGGYGIAKEFTN